MFKSMLSAVAIMLFGITAWSISGPVPQGKASSPAPVQVNPVKPTAQSQARARQIYTVDCAMCHGANGNGKTGLAADMNLTLGDWSDPKTLAGRTDQDLFTIIRDGKDKMPSEPEGRAKDSEVWILILYIRAMAKQQPAAAGF
jgi:mono/diheme cytochrome c family protein